MKSLLTYLCFLLGACTVCAQSAPSAVIEEVRTHLIVPDLNSLTVKEFKRIKILDENGYQFARYKDYYNSFKKVKSVQYTVFDANNQRVKRLSKADALDILINPSYEVSDARTLAIDPDFRSFPFTVEIEVESSYNGFINFDEWIPRFA